MALANSARTRSLGAFGIWGSMVSYQTPHFRLAALATLILAPNLEYTPFFMLLDTPRQNTIIESSLDYFLRQSRFGPQTRRPDGQP